MLVCCSVSLCVVLMCCVVCRVVLFDVLWCVVSCCVVLWCVVLCWVRRDHSSIPIPDGNPPLSKTTYPYKRINTDSPKVTLKSDLTTPRLDIKDVIRVSRFGSQGTPFPRSFKPRVLDSRSLFRVVSTDCLCVPLQPRHAGYENVKRPYNGTFWPRTSHPRVNTTCTREYLTYGCSPDPNQKI